MPYPDRPTSVNSDAPFDLPPPPNPQAGSFYSWCIALWQWTVKFGQNIRSSVTTLSSSTTTSLAGKLNKASADTLQGTISIQASTVAGIKTGTITWDSSGVLSGGTGVAITANGIVGASGGTAKFVIQADGTATFAGALSAPSGTIGGFTIGASDLSIASGGNTTTISSGTTAFSTGPTGSPTFSVTRAGAVTCSNITVTGATSSVDVSGYIRAYGTVTEGSTVASIVGSSAYNGIYGITSASSTGYSGIRGNSSTSGNNGVLGVASHSGGYGVQASNTNSGVALYVSSGHISYSGVTSTGATGTGDLVFGKLPTLKYTDDSTLTFSGSPGFNQTFMGSGGGVSSGSSAITMTNYPNAASSGTVFWLKVYASGAIIYIPYVS